jgi:hypothetical protein
MTSAVATQPMAVTARFVLTDAPNRHLLDVECPDGIVRLDVHGTPDVGAARLFALSVRRIHLVRFCRTGGHWAATAEVTGHRLPQRRPIPIGTALGLALQGHRITVCADTLERQGVDDGRLPL